MKHIFNLSLITIIFTLYLILGVNNAKAATINQLSELPVTGNLPQVTSQLPLSITELPRTGIPAIAWAVIVLTPMGARLLKINKSDKSSVSPNSIWTEKQFKNSL